MAIQYGPLVARAADAILPEDAGRSAADILEEGDSALENFFRFLQRPGFAVMSLLSGNPIGALQNIGQMALDLPTGGFISRHYSLANLLPDSLAPGEDITSKEDRPQFTNMLSALSLIDNPDKPFGNEAGETANWVGRLGLNVVGGAILDPLSYLGGIGGVGNVASKVLGAAGRGSVRTGGGAALAAVLKTTQAGSGVLQAEVRTGLERMLLKRNQAIVNNPEAAGALENNAFFRKVENVLTQNRAVEATDFQNVSRVHSTFSDKTGFSVIEARAAEKVMFDSMARARVASGAPETAATLERVGSVLHRNLTHSTLSEGLQALVAAGYSKSPSAVWKIPFVGDVPLLPGTNLGDNFLGKVGRYMTAPGWVRYGLLDFPHTKHIGEMADDIGKESLNWLYANFYDKTARFSHLLGEAFTTSIKAIDNERVGRQVQSHRAQTEMAKYLQDESHARALGQSISEEGERALRARSSVIEDWGQAQSSRPNPAFEDFLTLHVADFPSALQEELAILGNQVDPIHLEEINRLVGEPNNSGRLHEILSQYIPPDRLPQARLISEERPLQRDLPQEYTRAQELPTENSGFGHSWRLEQAIERTEYGLIDPRAPGARRLRNRVHNVLNGNTLGTTVAGHLLNSPRLAKLLADGRLVARHYHLPSRAGIGARAAGGRPEWRAVLHLPNANRKAVDGFVRDLIRIEEPLSQHMRLNPLEDTYSTVISLQRQATRPGGRLRDIDSAIRARQRRGEPELPISPANLGRPIDRPVALGNDPETRAAFVRVGLKSGYTADSIRALLESQTTYHDALSALLNLQTTAAEPVILREALRQGGYAIDIPNPHEYVNNHFSSLREELIKKSRRKMLQHQRALERNPHAQDEALDRVVNGAMDLIDGPGERWGNQPFPREFVDEAGPLLRGERSMVVVHGSLETLTSLTDRARASNPDVGRTLIDFILLEGMSITWVARRIPVGISDASGRALRHKAERLASDFRQTYGLQAQGADTLAARARAFKAMGVSRNLTHRAIRAGTDPASREAAEQILRSLDGPNIPRPQTEENIRKAATLYRDTMQAHPGELSSVGIWEDSLEATPWYMPNQLHGMYSEIQDAALTNGNLRRDLKAVFRGTGIRDVFTRARNNRTIPGFEARMSEVLARVANTAEDAPTPIFQVRGGAAQTFPDFGASEAVRQAVLPVTGGQPVMGLSDVEGIIERGLRRLAARHGVTVEGLGLEDLQNRELDILKLFTVRNRAHNRTIARAKMAREAQRHLNLGGREINTETFRQYLNFQFEPMRARTNWLQKVIGGGSFRLNINIADSGAARRWALRGDNQDGYFGRRIINPKDTNTGAAQIEIDWPGLNYFWKPALTSLALSAKALPDAAKAAIAKVSPKAANATIPLNPSYLVKNTVGAWSMLMLDPAMRQGNFIANTRATFEALFDSFFVRTLGVKGFVPDEIANFMTVLGDTDPRRVQEALTSIRASQRKIGNHSMSEVMDGLDVLLGGHFTIRGERQVLGSADLAFRWTDYDFYMREITQNGPSLKIAFNRLVKLGTDTAEFTERRLRAQGFISLLEKGVPIDEAIKRVGDAFVDYSMNSTAERWLRDVIPFAKWSLGAAKWGEKVLTDPPTRAFLNAAGRARNPGEGEFLPERAEDSLALPLPWLDSEGNKIFLLGLGLPLETTLQLLALPTAQGARRLVLGGLQPALQLPLKAVTNRNFYFGDDFGDYRKAPAWARVIPGLVTEVPVGDGRIRYEISGTANEIISAMPTSRIESMIDKWFDTRRSVIDKVLNSLTGIRTVSVDVEQEFKLRMMDYLKAKALSGQVGETLIYFDRFKNEDLPEDIRIMLESMKTLKAEARKKRASLLTPAQ